MKLALVGGSQGEKMQAAWKEKKTREQVFLVDFCKKNLSCFFFRWPKPVFSMGCWGLMVHIYTTVN